MVVLTRPIGYTKILSFLLYHTEAIPAITAINSNQVVCNRPMYIDSNKEIIIIVKLKHFKDPKPAREISLIFPKTELKIQIIDALRQSISGVIRGAIAFQNVEIINPLPKK